MTRRTALKAAALAVAALFFRRRARLVTMQGSARSAVFAGRPVYIQEGLPGGPMASIEPYRGAPLVPADRFRLRADGGLELCPE